MIHLRTPVTDRMSGVRFYLLWVALTTVAGASSIVVALPIAFTLGFFWAFILGQSVDAPPSVFFMPLPVAAVGGVAGTVVGATQTAMLSWPRRARDQWTMSNMCGWGIGAGLGTLAIAVYDLQMRDALPGLPIIPVPYFMPIMTAVLGVVVGLVQWRVIPSPSPSPVLWVAGSVVAASLGWLVAVPPGRASFLGLTGTGIIVGPLVYAMISGAMMLRVERGRSAAAAEV